METAEKNEITDERLAELNKHLETAVDVIYLFLDLPFPIPPHDGSRVYFSFLSVWDRLDEMGLRLTVKRKGEFMGDAVCP